MEFSSMNYMKVDNNNTNNASMKRKHEHDPQEEQYNSQKRMHLIDQSTLVQQEDMMVSSLPSPPPTTSFNKMPNSTTFQLSANATANRANVVLPSTPPEDVMMEDESTDEDEVLQTPSTTAVRYIAYDVGDDLDQGGFIGSLERGWSEMFNEMY